MASLFPGRIEPELTLLMSSNCNLLNGTLAIATAEEESHAASKELAREESSSPSASLAKGLFEGSQLEGEEGKHEDGLTGLDDESLSSYHMDEWTNSYLNVSNNGLEGTDVARIGPPNEMENLAASFQDDGNDTGGITLGGRMYAPAASQGFDQAGKMGSTKQQNYKRKAGGIEVKVKAKKHAKKKDPKSSDAAKGREFGKFTRYFDEWLSNQLVGMPPGWPVLDEDFLQYARQMIENDIGVGQLDEHTKKRLLYVLDEKNSSGKTYAEFWWMTVKSFGKVPRGGYQKNECPVCKVAVKQILDMTDHDCPYCHRCYHESGWKKKCVLKGECTTNHAPVDS